MTWHYIWTNQLGALTSAQIYDNAKEIWDLLTGTYNFTEQAAAGVIGNFQYESQMNPAQWQYGKTIGDWDNKTTGLGLGQWTPPSKLGDYCGGNTQAAISDGAKQVQFTATNSGQWVQRVNSRGYSDYYGLNGILYFTSIAEYSQATNEPEDMATVWCACWEGCGKKYFQDTYNGRREAARYWYDMFSGSSTGGWVISFQIEGNGVATAVPSRATAGTSILITATPASGETFLGWSVAQSTAVVDPTLNPQSFLMVDSPVVLVARFTGITPEPPEPYWRKTKEKKMPIWMYPASPLRLLKNT